MKFKKAFTMAEAILVMTILGIIATIMITTLKPAQFKDKGLEIMARKVLSEIDTAITQILINDAPNGKLRYWKFPNVNIGCEYSYDGDCANEQIKLFKKYLATTRQEVSNNSYCRTNGAIPFYLKDGACVGFAPSRPFVYQNIRTIFPGESYVPDIAGSVGVFVQATSAESGAMAFLYVDTNGDDEPNVFGKDQFTWPISQHGIMYDED